MCLATLTTNGRTLTDEQIRNAWNANPHGGGIAYFDSTGKVQAFRTLSLPKFQRAYARLIDEGLHYSPMALHFRLATHGDKTINNVHPFRMDANTLVIHNGMFPIEPNDSRSDSCVFVTETLPKLGSLWFDDSNLHNLVQGYCDGGYPNKLVVLTDNPNAKFRAYVINASAGYWDAEREVWYSNRSHEGSKKRATVTSGNANSWVHYPNEDWNAIASSDDWEECGMCGEASVTYLDETKTRTCYLCGTCQTCAFDFSECTCSGEVATLRTDDAGRIHAQDESEFSLWHM